MIIYAVPSLAPFSLMWLVSFGLEVNIQVCISEGVDYCVKNITLNLLALARAI